MGPAGALGVRRQGSAFPLSHQSKLTLKSTCKLRSGWVGKENRVSSFLRRSLAFGTWVLWYTPVGHTRRRTASVREMEEARELGS